MKLIQRRTSIWLGASIIAVAACSWLNVNVRAGSAPGTSGIATLEDQLEKGLRVRLPQEFKFVEEVVRQIKLGRLPEKIVRSTFHYARRRNAKRPYPYFERALRLRAARLGLTLAAQSQT